MVNMHHKNLLDEFLSGDRYNKTVGSEVPAFGVGPHNPEEDEQNYHTYYQWVPFVLFFQGILFMIPHILWKAWEDGRLRAYAFLELPGGAKMKVWVDLTQRITGIVGS